MTATAEAALTAQEEAEESKGTGNDSLGDLLERLLGNMRSVFFAEVDLLQVIYWTRFKAALFWVAMTLAAMVICLAAMAALLVGFIIAAAPMMGAIWATVTIGGGALLAGIILAIVAMRRLDRRLSALAAQSTSSAFETGVGDG